MSLKWSFLNHTIGLLKYFKLSHIKNNYTISSCTLISQRNLSSILIDTCNNHNIIQLEKKKNKQIQLYRQFWKLFQRKNFGTYDVVKCLGNVSASCVVPPGIDRPGYWQHGEPQPPPRHVEIKEPHQIEAMRRVCTLAREVMDVIGRHIKVGITTEELDAVAHAAIIERDCYPSPLNYRHFPKSICTSVNNVACHGIPDDRPLHLGDIISTDVTVYHGGMHGDCCETWCVEGSDTQGSTTEGSATQGSTTQGSTTEGSTTQGSATSEGTDAEGRRLVQCARATRDAAIALCKPGTPLYEIGRACHRTARAAGFYIVPAFAGHGIGDYFHGPPDILHFDHQCGDEVMQPGMTFTIEPVVAQSNAQIEMLEDGWTVVMVDNARTAQFEHTVLITAYGHEVLTKYST